MQPSTALWRSFPESSEYISQLKRFPLTSDADEEQYLTDIERLASGGCDREILQRVVFILKTKPATVHRLNALIQPRYRLECSRHAQSVEFFAVFEQKKAWIHSTISPSLQESLISSDEDITDVLVDDAKWHAVGDSQLPDQRLECIAQILQEILDDPDIQGMVRKRAQKYITILAKNKSIIPPSLFVDFHSLGIANPKRLMDDAIYVASGGGCDVYHVMVGTQPVCLRFLRQTGAYDQQATLRIFYSEVIVWRQLRHRNIAPLLGITMEVQQGRFCFILPWYPAGSIVLFLKKNPNHCKHTVITQIVAGVEYLHSLIPPVVHKDIKGANILVDEENVCVLADFGLSSVVETMGSSTKGAGSLPWMAPECFPLSPQTDVDKRPRDVYAVGCTIYEVLTGSPPFLLLERARGRGEAQMPPSGQWSRQDLNLWEVAKMCIALDIADRPSIVDASTSLSSGVIMKVKKVEFTEISENDIIIALLGATGVGKSSFIAKAAGMEGLVEVGHDLRSCTSEISTIRLSVPTLTGADIILVDTPPFDDTNKPDSETLKTISEWLVTTYQRGLCLSGVLYFQRISDNSMMGPPSEILQLVQKICGEFKNITITTTMWDDVEEEEGNQREKELMEIYWKSMIKRGAQVRRFYHSQPSAFEVLGSIIDKKGGKQALLLQTEMVTLNKGLDETEAGKMLNLWLQGLADNHQEMLGRIRKELKEPELTTERMKELMATYQKVSTDLRMANEEMQIVATKATLSDRGRSLRAWQKIVPFRNK